jgi:1,4-alpha-glucan branching enzyme
MSETDWRAPDGAVDALLAARHGDPFAVLGPHPAPGGVAIRALAPDAETLEAVNGAGARVVLERTRAEGFFEGLAPKDFGPYRLCAANQGGTWVYLDPYAFDPVLGAMDDHLLVEGEHRRLYERLGAQVLVHQHTPGVHFAVWAPHATRVSVVGDFNSWDGRRHAMRKRIDSGVWEIFVPALTEGTVYKYEIVSAAGDLLPLKADPFGFASELRPATGSVVARTDSFPWGDAAHVNARAKGAPHRAPMSIYEVHLGSWRRRADGWFLSYDELADQLIPYVVDMGFTHIELMPVTEHPLDESWGYQPIGLFAPTRRHGDPAGFARFVDKAHQAGLSVLLDWTPAHFPVDQHGLANFDGQPLYEHADPSRGFHPDWNTAIYDFGRKEVANVLVANALYWMDRFHIDGLRVDAVASMLHLNYSREDGAWTPNAEGGVENREAEAFLQGLNRHVHAAQPGTVMAAEESSTWPGVSRPVHEGGLGFGFKWNMGWMNDTLEYLALDPVHRRFHHDKLTFGLLYAFTENFILPVSHDEVVHGKGTLLSRAKGDEWQRFANVRAYLGYMWGHPGKKLLFMGQEFAQRHEWSYEHGLDWWLLDHPPHVGVQRLVRDLNHLYRAQPALHARDFDPDGFRWIVVDDADQSVVVWMRLGRKDDPPVVVACNFTPVPRTGYRIGLPQAGTWREVFNSDSEHYGGSGMGNFGAVQAGHDGSHGLPASADVTLPPLACVYFVLSKD